MSKMGFGRIAAAFCLVSIAGCALSGCASKNADSAATSPASGGVTGNNQAAIDHGKAIAAAYAHRQQSSGAAAAPSHP